MKEFCLLDEAWILVTDQNGVTQELSIKEVFAKAHELSALANELPALDAALLRLLLSILYAVFDCYDETGAELPDSFDASDAKALWQRLWDHGRFPVDAIEKYLRQYQERFYLFHPKYPFWQVCLEHPPVDRNGVSLKPTVIGAGKFIGDLADGDKPNLFSARRDKNHLELREAARWLVYLNAFDVSPAGNPGKNPRTVKGFGHPWPANLGLVWASGKSIFQTLLMNLVILNGGDLWPNKKNKYAWEWEPPRTADDLERVDIAPPSTPGELLSLQYRYVALRREGGYVTGYDLWSGVKFDGQDYFIEQMTAWKAKKDGKFFPRRHDPAKQIWRDFAALVPLKQEEGKYRPPGVVSWLEYVDMPPRLIRLNTAGIEYVKDTAVADVYSDSLQLNVGLLSRLGDNWRGRIVNELAVTEECIKDSEWLARNIVLAAGGDKECAGARGKAANEEACFRLDEPFRTWLAFINPVNDDLEDKCEEWREVLGQILLKLGKEIVSGAGEQAFVGRKKGDRLVSAPQAYMWFKSSLYAKLKGRG